MYIYRYLKLESRLITWERNTKETKISLKLNLDGTGKSTIDTGIAFFDHMLDQLSRHGQMDLELKVKGDLEVDEHHTIEDTALALGEAFDGAIGDKMGMERYGFCLPMDDCRLIWPSSSSSFEKVYRSQWCIVCIISREIILIYRHSGEFL